MISIIKESEYQEFKERNYVKPDDIIIELKDDKDFNNINNILAGALNGPESPSTDDWHFGLDGLNSVLGDWFDHTWTQGKKVFILGWDGYTDFVPKDDIVNIISIFYSAYLSVIYGHLCGIIKYKEETFEESMLYESVVKNPPRIYLVS